MKRTNSSISRDDDYSPDQNSQSEGERDNKRTKSNSPVHHDSTSSDDDVNQSSNVNEYNAYIDKVLLVETLLLCSTELSLFVDEERLDITSENQPTISLPVCSPELSLFVDEERLDIASENQPTTEAEGPSYYEVNLIVPVFNLDEYFRLAKVV